MIFHDTIPSEAPYEAFPTAGRGRVALAAMTWPRAAQQVPGPRARRRPSPSRGRPSPSPESADPGSLDPQAGAGSTLIQLDAFAYDSLVAIDPRGGIKAGLASSWTVNPSDRHLTIKGSPARTARPSPHRPSPTTSPMSGIRPARARLLGVFIPVGATATARPVTVSSS